MPFYLKIAKKHRLREAVKNNYIIGGSKCFIRGVFTTYTCCVYFIETDGFTSGFLGGDPCLSEKGKGI